jgi:glucosyl-3-phosphoglycerate synthase
VRPGWGLEVGTLGEAFEHAGFDGSAQVDLGRHEHDHRAVSGPTGLSEMSRGVAGAVLRTVEEAGLAPDYDDLAERYRTVARRLVDQYAADAAFNDLDHDAADERQQVDRYAESVAPPGPDRRLPAWRGVDLAPDAVLAASREAVDDADGPTVDGASDPDGSERPGSGRE